MSTKFRQVCIYTGMIVVLAFTSVVYAQPYEGDRERAIKCREEMMDDLVGELGLTPQQQEQFKKQCKANHEHRRKYRQLLRGEQEKLRVELEKKDFNEKKMEKIVAELKNLWSKLIDRKVADGLKIKEILTPEQFRELGQKKETFRKGAKDKHRRRRKKREKIRDEKKVKDDLFKELDLTSKQQEQLEKQRKTSRVQRKKHRSLLQDKQEKLRDEMEKKGTDKRKIEKIAGELKTLWGEAIEQRTDTILKIKEILTPEQFEKFQQKKNTFKHKKAGKRGHPGGKGKLNFK